MDVFVIPIGRERYELYCETSTQPIGDGPPSATVLGRVQQKFWAFLHAAEERRHRHHHDERAADTFVGRLKEKVMAWVAERVAEQRLLWNLRSETEVVAAHPPDLTTAQMRTLVIRMLQRDFERHRRWMIIDGVLFVVTFVALGPLFLLIPGIANLPALYFGFRTFGHFLSMRGAARGVSGITWQGRACAPLGELRDMAVLAPGARAARVHAIAAELQLPHLATFFERVAVHPAQG